MIEQQYSNYGSMMDRLKQVTALSDSAGDPMSKFPDYLSQYRKKYAKNMLGFNPNMFTGNLPTNNGFTPGGTTTNSGPGGWGNARASSYWGENTAEGIRMNGSTIASPYLPLGTIVEVRKNGKTVRGRVGDFGPADWVMRGDPSRFLDLAEPMMQTLTGTRSNLTGVSYRILKYGTGRIYRPNAPMTRELRKMWGM